MLRVGTEAAFSFSQHAHSSGVQCLSFYILTSETRSQYHTTVLQIIIQGQRQTEKHKGVKTDGGHSTELKMSHIETKT